jgi:hypothetical protein
MVGGPAQVQGRGHQKVANFDRRVRRGAEQVVASRLMRSAQLPRTSGNGRELRSIEKQFGEFGLFGIHLAKRVFMRVARDLQGRQLQRTPTIESASSATDK